MDIIHGDCGISQIRATFCNDTGDDTLSGDSGNDELVGDNGADKLVGEADDDYLLGWEGDDELDGGEGNDEIEGDGGRLYRETGNGADRLIGAGGNDRLLAGAGNDTLIDGPGDDELDGFEGDDLMYSDPAGADDFTGRSGVDTIDYSDRTADLTITVGTRILEPDDGQVGERDNVGSDMENVIAGAGNDSIEDCCDEFNTFHGGPGNDTIYPHRGADTHKGGEGTDTLSYAPFVAPSRVYFSVSIHVFEGKARSTEPSPPLDTTFSEFERYIGGEKGDILRGSFGADYMDGLGGNDLIQGSFGPDELLGGSGDDTVEGEEGDDRLFGNDGNDGLKGGGGNDTMTGGAGKDSFDGGPPPPGEEKDVATDHAGTTLDGSCTGAMGCQ